jgi:hypothetical protein
MCLTTKHMSRFKFVYVPCDSHSPMEEWILTPKDLDAHIGCLAERLQLWYALTFSVPNPIAHPSPVPRDNTARPRALTRQMNVRRYAKAGGLSGEQRANFREHLKYQAREKNMGDDAQEKLNGNNQFVEDLVSQVCWPCDCVIFYEKRIN